MSEGPVVFKQIVFGLRTTSVWPQGQLGEIDGDGDMLSILQEIFFKFLFGLVSF